MGKQVKGWIPPEEDEVLDQEKPAAKTAWMPPAQDEVVGEPVKKKEPAGSVSPAPAQKPGAPSGESIAQVSQEQQSDLAQIDLNSKSPGSMSSLELASKTKAAEIVQTFRTSKQPLDTPVQALINTIKSGIADQIPKEYYVQRLRMSKGSFGDLFDTRSNLSAFGTNLPLGISQDEFARWSNDNRSKILGKSYDDRAKSFLTEKLGEKGFENMKAAFQSKNIEQRIGFERNIQQQNVEAGKRTAGVVQNIKDINGAASLLNFTGGMLGQALYRVPLSKVSEGWASVMAESAAVYDRQLDLIAKREGKTREEIIRLGLDKPADGQALAVLAGTMDAASSMNLLGWFKKAAVKELPKKAVVQFAKEFAKGGIPEAITEAAQGEIEEFAASKGAEVEYNPDAWRIATAASGGLLGGGIISGAVSVNLTHDQQVKSTPEVISDQVKNPNLEQAAEIIQAKIEQSRDSGVYEFKQPTSEETQAASAPQPTEGEVSETQKEETLPVQEKSAEAKTVTERIEQTTGPESGSYQYGEEYEVIPRDTKNLTKGKNFDYLPNKSLSGTEKQLEEKFGKDLDEKFESRKKEYQDKFGNVLDADNAKELSDDYNKDPQGNATAVHNPGSSFLFRVYTDELKNPAPKGKENKVTFVVGGAAAGK